MKMNEPYVYKWTHLPTMMWYVGSRVAKRCHPNDGYICSSKIVEPMIVANPEEWQREIIHRGQDAYDVESEILQLFNARDDVRSFNGHNNDGKFSTAGITLSAERCEQIKVMRTGRKSQQHSDKVTGKGNPMYGVTRDDHSLNMTGDGNPRYLGIIVGTNTVTGHELTFTGSAEMKASGFHHGHIYNCVNGKKKQYKGYTWSRMKDE